MTTLALLMAICCPACRRGDPDDPSIDAVSTKTVAAEVVGPQYSAETTPPGRLPVIDPAAIGLDVRSSDPGADRDGWDSEATSAADDAQLKSMGKQLAHPGKIDESQMEKLVGADIQCGPLRPAKLWTVLDDSALNFRPDATDIANDNLTLPEVWDRETSKRWVSRAEPRNIPLPTQVVTTNWQVLT